ncbi:hypothetical protein Fmac_024082 [Flemingia macrophylla]|uniref:Glycosyl-hydrolase family 116 N-terminal domain-containing protein n=1 Tax=Flemingia macrophylla TaxID=520843 RepID=A0ABD1LNE7_9FABA
MSIYTYTGVAAYQEDLKVSSDKGKLFLAHVKRHLSWPISSLSSKKPDDQGISSWGWNLSGQHSTYHALFPRAWTIYDEFPWWKLGFFRRSCERTIQD